MRRFAVALAFFAVAGLTPASAQTVGPARPEFGVGVNWLIPIYSDYSTDEFSEPTGHVRITWPFARHFSLEGITTIGRRTDDYSSRTEGLYVVQVQQRLGGSDHSLQTFVTYGGAGYYSHVVYRAASFNGVTMPHGSFSKIEPPVATTVGVGVQQRLARRLAIRVDAQLLTLLYLPLGYALSTSVSVPLR
jgi:hypothetical protein